MDVKDGISLVSPAADKRVVKLSLLGFIVHPQDSSAGAGWAVSDHTQD